jgi:hypothetical protein
VLPLDWVIDRCTGVTGGIVALSSAAVSDDGDFIWERFTIDQYIGRWKQAIERQHDRVLAAARDSDAFETEVHLYAVSLNQLVTMVEWAESHTKGDGSREARKRIQGALGAFRQAVPDLDKVRDIHEHITQYERGHGLLQKKQFGGDPAPPLARWYTQDAVHVLGLTLNVRTSASAAADLVDRVEAALGMGDFVYQSIRVTPTSTDHAPD